jgi:hypothetical protein
MKQQVHNSCTKSPSLKGTNDMAVNLDTSALISWRIIIFRFIFCWIFSGWTWEVTFGFPNFLDYVWLKFACSVSGCCLTLYTFAAPAPVPLYIFRIWSCLYSQQVNISLSVCSWNTQLSYSNFRFLVFLFYSGILFRKWKSSHRTLAFNTQYFTAQHFS